MNRIHRWKNLLYSLAFASIALPIFTVPCIAETDQPTRLTSTSMVLDDSGPEDPAEMESFLDDFFTKKMEEMHIPGAAFVMVKDGEVFLMKGYGYADLENNIPVDPERTIFRGGSISKLFTCTAVMQAVEKEQLAVDTDVNSYLTEFHIPSTYSAPVTLDTLMTHTAGFEDRWIGYETYDEDKTMQLGQFVQSNVPERVMAPGLIHSYSNYGIDLAGYLVEKVSSTPFPEYIENNIFQPLGMNHSTFEQSIPPSLATDLAVGYRYSGSDYEAVPFSYVNTVPSSGISTTAADMASFMITHLQNGRYQNTRILQEATAQQMHQQQFTHHPELPGMTYGFKERYINGERVIGHGGDLHTFSAQMILLPERNEGFFVIYNRFDDAFREDLISAIFSRYYPAQPESAIEPSPSLAQRQDLARFSGRYRWVKYPRTTLGKLIALVPGPYNLTIKPEIDGNLSLSFFGAGAKWIYTPVEPLVFKQVSGGPQLIGDLRVDPGNALVFREEEDGRISHGFVSLQNTAFEKLSWYEFPEVTLGTLGALLIVFISPLVLWPIISLVRSIRKRSSRMPGAGRRAFWLAGIVSGLNILFVACLILTFGENMVFGVTPFVKILLAIPIITGFLTLILVALGVLIWKEGYGSIAGRIHYSLITLSAIVFIIWANYWNLIGFRF